MFYSVVDARRSIELAARDSVSIVMANGIGEYVVATTIDEIAEMIAKGFSVVECW